MADTGPRAMLSDLRSTPSFISGRLVHHPLTLFADEARGFTGMQAEISICLFQWHCGLVM